MESFRAFTPTHAACLLAIALATALAVALRRRATDAAARGVERTVGLAYLGVWLLSFAWHLQAPHFDPATTLPLQLCHLTAAAAALRLVTEWRVLRPLVYFWGIALSTQALLTPSLAEGPALYPFWFFWVTHGLIVGVAVYDVAARGYRPDLRGYAVACLGAAAYGAIVLPLDLAFGWNYGFVGPSRPEVRTIVDFLGPWPLRLVPIVLIVAAAMALALAPWSLARRFGKGV